jgi:hypothetical protein
MKIFGKLHPFLINQANQHVFFYYVVYIDKPQIINEFILLN